MRYIIKFSLVLLFILGISSCREDFSTSINSGNLRFSKDTVYLDTVFTNIGSSTYQFKVYNNSDDDISIPQVTLAKGENSKFRLNVNGRTGKLINNVEILAKDSIFVFVEVTADISEVAQNSLEFLYTDQINFTSSSQTQKVELVSLIKDARFLYPERFPDGTTETLSLGQNADGEEVLIEGFFMSDQELVMTNEKPYVIYGFAAVPSGKTLQIEPGARLHFHDGSGLIAANGATIHAIGDYSSTDDLENEIIFESDRLEPEFSDVPGQWNTVWLTAGSTNHIFEHVTIKNATVGVLMDSSDGTINPTLQLKNTQIYNSSNVGLLARTGNIIAENLVINNAGQAALNLSLGGTYDFKHCTLVNYWQNSFRNFPAVLIENELETQEQIFVADLNASFSNCIIYGNENIELQFNANENAAFNINFDHSLVRFNDFNNNFANEALYNFDDTSIYTNIILNETPDFLNPQENQLIIGQDSAANISGNQTTANQVPLDILSEDRTLMPNLGAYQSIIFDD
ncbi:hypothetical protein [Psychroflexus sp. ALD_RP9]|uniref:hypothetical protein n=1 Tax=Psychroflexus sp. ALD_RP9 TaxID=2777186 RepID=UPI001A8F9032|nr:hypothetical protein [Psychroflexus sp. ALD_RP9]QSS97400.1 hypothetical protein IMZ30_01410 [Psychroflexus sp. ALD_RP9]